jgi:hypothetical protein
MNSYKICLTILEFNTYLNLTILPNRRQTYAARVNSFRPTNPAPQSVSSFFLVKYPEINYKGNSFCRGESAIEFKRDQGSPRFALRRDPLSGTDAMPSLSGGSA